MGLFSGENDEKRPLIGPSRHKNSSTSGSSSGEYSNYGSAPTSNSTEKNKKGKTSDPTAIERIPLSKLFRFATLRDKWIIFVGTIFAIIHGAGFPLLALVFGSMTDTFMVVYLYGFANSTVNSTLDLTNISFPTIDLMSEYAKLNGSDSTIKIPPLLTREQFSEFMTTFSLFYLYIGAAVFVASFVQALCWEWACERQTYRLRQEFFYQVLRQEISWFDSHQTGDLATKLSDDLERIREGIGHKFSMVIQFAATFLAGFAIGFYTSWQLTLVILSLTPLLAGTSAFSGKMIATQSTREQQKYGKAGAVAEEVLSCIRTVASFGGENREIKRYENSLNAGLKMAVKKYHVFAVAIGLVFFIMYGSYALAFWYGCQLISDGLLTPGEVFTVFFSVLVGAFSLGNAVPFISSIGIAQGSGAVVFDVIDSMPDIDPYSKKGLMLDKIHGKIEFRNVNFRYPSRKAIPVLQEFNLTIDPGKTVAIVGTSGAGKSTIVSLILRFYDADSGSVLVDGNDVRQLNLAWLRHHIGVVSQEPVLFGTTIYENINYGREEITPEEVVTAARMANAHDFISALPQGYETLVGERGAQLSGGQKQRIAIARALVRDPKILLLDEATSALDAKSESLVQTALDRARKGRTTIIIAHRLSTVKDADVIYALKDGIIAESGTHGQLMSKEGLYYELVMAQTSMDVDIDDQSGFSASVDDSADEAVAGNLIYLDPAKTRRRGRRSRRLNIGAMPDPDKSRLMQEAIQLNVQYPGIWKILKVNKPEWLLLLIGGIGCIITGLIMPVFAFFYSEMFSTFSKTGTELMDGAFFWAMMFLVLASVSFFGFWIRTIFVASAGEYLTMRLRLNSYISIVKQPIGWFDKESNTPSRLTTRLARDAPLVKAAAGHRLGTALSAFVTIFAGVGGAFIFGWQLALVISVGFPVLVFAGYIQVQVQKGGQKKDAALMEDAGRCANEAIANIRTVQSLSQESTFFSKYLEHLYPVYIEGHKQAFIYGLAFAFSEAVIFGIYAAAFRYGAYLVSVDIMDPFDVYRVFFLIGLCAVSVGQATSWIPDYTKANLAAALIFNLIELKSEIDPFNVEGLQPTLEGRVTFNNVHFRYPSRLDSNVLQGLSFEVQPGQTLALVGPSGCGKSTVVSLLERFYDVISGQVLVDGFDLRTLNLQYLRSSIGLVTQEPVLFDCSVRENIAYGFGGGHQDVPEDLIIKAAQSANIHNFICGLPKGYDTLVGERGTQLSGGQKQRIAIARALIRDPKILLLDEATSALDTESEKIVQEALDRARAGRTCIVIAHRLSTIQNADCIAVISRGKVAEMGTHEQLRAKKGYYYKLTKKQQITH